MGNTYGGTTSRRSGIRKEKLHFEPLRKYFAEADIKLTESTLDENRGLKVDYWAKMDKYPKKGYDFKSGDYPENGFSLTYKINGTNKHVFEVGEPNRTCIFLMEHKETYAFVKKKDIYAWYLKKLPNLKPCKTDGDDSNYFWFPTRVVEALKFKEVSYENLL